MASPKFEITPKHVIRFFRKTYRMKVSEADARRWLKLWAYTFACEMKDIIAPRLGDLFSRATLRDYPNQAFTRFYKKILDAIAIAEGQHEAKIGMEYRGSTMVDPEYCKMVLFVMKGGEAVFWQSVAFVVPGAPRRSEEEHAPYRFHISVQGRKVTARIMEADEAVSRKLRVFGRDATTHTGDRSAKVPELKSTSVH